MICPPVLPYQVGAHSVSQSPMPQGSLIFFSLGDASSLLFKSRESSQMAGIPSIKLDRPVDMCALQQAAARAAIHSRMVVLRKLSPEA